MNTRFLLLLLILFMVSSCSKDEGFELNEDEINIIDYFKDIAIGFEFGNSSNVTRKWNSELRIFIGGKPNAELENELENIKREINELATDGFEVNIVDDSLQSNYYIFFGSGNEYAEMLPSQSDLVNSNWGLFSVFFNDQNQFTSGHMYVDIIRANSNEQKHLLREELTQSLGLAKDSPLYMGSIFQSRWTTTTEYALIDRDIIRLLYHPNMSVGLNENQVGDVLKEILISER